MRRHDGSSVAIQYSISPLLSRDGEALGVVLVIRDVTENRNMAKQLSYQAAHDALTGLINRREFEERLGQALDWVSGRAWIQRGRKTTIDLALSTRNTA